jgi:hypothetical protein
VENARFGVAVYVWEEDLCWNPARGLSMRITTAAGKDVQSPVLLDCLVCDPEMIESGGTI